MQATIEAEEGFDTNVLYRKAMFDCLEYFEGHYAIPERSGKEKKVFIEDYICGRENCE